MLKALLPIAVVLLSIIMLVNSSCSNAPPPSSSQPAISPRPPSASIQTAPSLKRYSAAPPMKIDPNKQYTAIMETAKGKMILELFAKDVPVTVNNFVFLAREGYYDNSTFHRVIVNFMAQGGDPTGTGSGGPGYYIKNEITSHKHLAVALSMARTAQPDTNGSQFFICYTPQPDLDGLYSVFGQLKEGMDVLKQLTPRDPTQNPQFPGDRLIKVTIEEK